MEHQDLDSINLSTKKEKFIKYIKINFKKIFGIFFILLLFILSFFFYNSFNEKKKLKISNKFNNIILNFNDQNNNETITGLKNIILEKDKTYSPLALYFLIENDLIKSNSEINNLFDIIIEDVGLIEDIKYLNIYKKLVYNLNFDNIEYILQISKPLLENDNIWQSHTQYLLGEYYYSKGNKIESKKYFEDIVLNRKGNIEIIKEAQKRLQRDLSE